MGSICHAVRSGWHHRSRSIGLAVLSGSSDDVIDPEGCFFLLLITAIGIPENHFLLLVLLSQIPGRGDWQFGQIHHLLLICKIGDLPLPLLFTPLRVVDNIVDLVLTHHDGQDSLEFLDLFFLESDGIE